MNKDGIELLKKFEGFVAHAYKDPVGVLTIGYGFTKGVKPGDTMTREEAEVRLKQEIASFELGVNNMISAPTNDNQRSAMVSLAYNIGLGAFKKSTVLRKHNQRDYEGAAKAFLMWVKAGGRVLKGLVRRRNAEMALYLQPIHQSQEDKEIAEVILASHRETPNIQPTGKKVTESKIQAANAVQVVTAISAIGLGSMDRYVGLAFIAVAAIAAYVIYKERKKHSEDDGV
jgi:lysozyme